MLLNIPKILGYRGFSFRMYWDGRHGADHREMRRQMDNTQATNEQLAELLKNPEKLAAVLLAHPDIIRELIRLQGEINATAAKLDAFEARAKS